MPKIDEILGNLKKMWNTPDDEYDYDDKHKKDDDYSDDEDYYSDDYSSSSSSDYDDDYSMPTYKAPDYSSTYNPPSYTPPSYTPPTYTAPKYTAPKYTPPEPEQQQTDEPQDDNSSKLEIVTFDPAKFSEETRFIADELVKGHTVVLNLDNTSMENSRRIIDFMSGAAYATGGKIKRAAVSTFVVIPKNIGITSDELLEHLRENGVIHE